MDFQYKVTVIVPVYNVEEYLRECLDSLVAQTIDHDKAEVLLINDGSADNSLAICNEYAEKHPMFKVFDKENEGVSATRNFGIRNAKGKYIMYLDSDDTVTENTLEAVSDFFDEFYDEVDVVTYKEVTYKADGTPQKPHYRYNYLRATGVYDLTKNIFCSQTLINIVVKNLGEDNYYFDEKIGYHEDQMYCNEILMNKMTLGYIDECEYRYNKHAGSISQENMNALFLFEKTTAYWESLFSKFEEVPQYFQALFFNDVRWKLRANALYPYHYEGEQFEHALGRIRKLLDKVDDIVILRFPNTNNFHRHYFLNLKSDRNKASVIVDNSAVSVQKNGLLLYRNKRMEIILSKLNVFNDNLCICAYLKSPIFNYNVSKPKIFAKITTFNKGVISKEIDYHLSYDSYYLSREKTNNFYGFVFEHDIHDIKKLEFTVSVDNVYYSCYYYFLPTAPFSMALAKYQTIFNNCIISFSNSVFYVELPDKTGIAAARAQANEKYVNNEDVYSIRNAADKIRDERIWLYYDCRGIEKDNGYLQFSHDFNKKDGVKRYYVNANEENINHALFTDEQRHFIVDFGSDEHKALYLASEKVITAYVENRNVIPFSTEEIPYYCDAAHPEVIYLQHGILHAHLPWKYAPGKILADKIVVSSYFELDSFTNTYKFREKDLIPAGMPRFDYIDTTRKPANRILFAPSWRNYLTKEDADRGWIIDDNKFMASDYFIKFNSFLNSESLGKFLEEKNVYLDFKLHPIFTPFLHCFDKKNPRVSFAGSSVDDSEYALFITDFSSFVFDFAYLKRPIMYFVPDMPQFKSGMNLYRELDLPFEKAFGKLVTEPEAAVDEVIRIIENGFVPDPVFKERMDNFYLPMDNCSEKLYRRLTENDKTADTENNIAEKPVEVITVQSKEPATEMINELPKEANCTGCGACANVCPVDAITMVYSEKGFPVPSIGPNCIDCGLCAKTCPSNNPKFENNRTPKFYSFCASDEIRKVSSSGGMFTVLADYVLEKGGYVCGAAFDENMRLRHIIVDNKEALAPIRGSKYLQSDMGTCYKDIKKLLTEGKHVLFTGTPCQVAGLYGVLKKDYDKLITVDLLCHGTPSQQLYDRYLDEIAKGRKVVSATFRDKRFGWNYSTNTVTTDDGAEYIGKGKDPWRNAFLKNLMMRYSCYNCQFCDYPRQGDFTIGDLWESAKLDPNSNDRKGTSFVFVNNGKAEEIFDKVSAKAKYFNEIKLKENEYSKIPNRVTPKTKPHAGRGRFLDLVKVMPFSKAADYALRDHYDICLATVLYGDNIGNVLTYYAFYNVLTDMGYTVLPIERPLDAPLKRSEQGVKFVQKWMPKYAWPVQYENIMKMHVLNDKCDMFVVGSDQIYLESMSKTRGDIFFFQYANSNKRKIGYAVSFGGTGARGSKEYYDTLKNYLNKFQHISCREDNGVDFANNELHLEPTVRWVLDPVFLCNEKHYMKLVRAVNKQRESEFIGSYLVKPRERIVNLMNKASEHFGNIPVECVGNQKAAAAIKSLPCECKSAFPVGNTLEMIYNCRFFVTDSFHGVCFCLIFKKDFLVIPRDFPDRFVSLLKRIGLEDRIITNNLGNLTEASFAPIDYDAVYEKLEALIKDSRDYLIHELTEDRETLKFEDIDTALKYIYRQQLEIDALKAEMAKINEKLQSAN